MGGNRISSKGGPYLVAGLVLALGVKRSSTISSLWRDETWTFSIASHPPRGLLNILWSQEPNMAPYYLALSAWQRINSSDTWLRMFSVLGGAACAVLLFRRLHSSQSRRSAYIGTLLLVFNPFFLHYLTEVRAYSWAMFLTLASVIELEKVQSRTRKARCGGIGILCGLAVATTFLSALVIAPAFGVLLLRIRHDRMAVRNAGLIAFAAACTVAPFGNAARIVGSTSISWVPALSLQTIRGTAIELMGGDAFAAILALGFFVALGHRLSRREKLRPLIDTEVGRLALIAISSFLLLVAFSAFVSPAMLPRYIAGTFPIIAMVGAIGLAQLARPDQENALALGLVVSIAMLVVVEKPFVAPPPIDQLRSAGDFLRDSVGPGDVVLYSHPFARMVLARYWIADASEDASSNGWPTSQLFATEKSAASTRTAVAGARRVWLVGYPDVRWERSTYPARVIYDEVRTNCATTDASTHRFGALMVVDCGAAPTKS